MSAADRGWGPGWPTDRRRDMVAVKAPLSGATFPAGVHRNIAELVTVLLEVTERRGYRCVVGWCWGYNNRPISRTRTPSNHSWGLAVDINAPTNPHTNRLVTDMPDWMPAMWEDCGFRWGGRYARRPDAMHYEYMGRPQDVQRHLERAVRYRERLLGPKEDALTPELKAELAAMEQRLSDRIDSATNAAARSVDKGRNLGNDVKFLREAVRSIANAVGLRTKNEPPEDLVV